MFIRVQKVYILAGLWMAFVLFPSCGGGGEDFLSQEHNVNVSWETSEGRRIAGLIDTLYFIPLEEHPDGLIASIDKIVATEDKLFVLDRIKQNVILAFDRNGKFLFRVGSRGGGPEEYAAISNFTVSGDRIYLLDNTARVILVYRTSDGSFLQRHRLDFSAQNLASIADGSFVFVKGFSLNHPLNEQDFRVFVTDDKFRIRKEMFPVNEDFSTLEKFNSLETNADQVVFHMYGMDYVAVFDQKDAESYTTYTFDFGGQRIPKDKRSDSKVYVSQNNYRYLFQGIFMVGSYLVGSAGIKAGVFVMDIRTGLIYVNDPNIQMGLDGKIKAEDPEYFTKNIYLSPIAAFENELFCPIDGMAYQTLRSIGIPPFVEPIDTFLQQGDNVVFQVFRLKQ